MDKIAIVDRFLNCTFSLQIDSIRVEPNLFCQLEKDLISVTSAEVDGACTHRVAKPYSFDVVMTNLQAKVNKSKLPAEITKLTQAEVKHIQTFIADNYNLAGNCYNCHYI